MISLSAVSVLFCISLCLKQLRWAPFALNHAHRSHRKEALPASPEPSRPPSLLPASPSRLAQQRASEFTILNKEHVHNHLGFFFFFLPVILFLYDQQIEVPDNIGHRKDKPSESEIRAAQAGRRLVREPHTQLPPSSGRPAGASLADTILQNS